MKWSKLKARVEENFASSLQGKVSIYSTAYGNCTCGRAWITLDKKTIAQFCTRAFWNRVGGEIQRKANRWVSDAPVPNAVSSAQRASYGAMEYGELSRQDAYQSCWEFVHDLSIDQAIESDDPLIQTLAVIDRRVGKRKLVTINPDLLHRLARKLLTERMKAEGLLVR